MESDPRLACTNVQRPLSETRADVLPSICRVKGNDRADRLAGKATITNDLRLGGSEVLRSLRHYLQAQSQGNHTIDRVEERVAETGSAKRSSLKGRERATVSQTNIATVSNITSGKPEIGWSAYGLFGAHTYHLELNWGLDSK